MKPHYRLHFHLFDGKTPLWWVSRTHVSVLCMTYTRTTSGYNDPAPAIREAVAL